MYGTVDQVLAAKGNKVLTTSQDTLLGECAHLMTSNGIGSLIITDDHNDIVGILYERDISRKCVSNNINPQTVAARDVMTKEFICVDRTTKVSDAMAIMTNERVRHLPVIENEQLLGLVSIGDLTKWVISGQEEDISNLVRYITDSYKIKMPKSY